VDCEVDIINLSFGFDSPQHDIDEAIDVAFRKNIIMFAATANHGAQQRMSWPARDPRVICVHSSDGYGGASAFTAKPEDSGCKNFAIVGDAINSPWIRENDTGHAKHPTMRRISGTSFATPVLAGFAATILHYVRVKLTDMDARLAAKAETLYGMLHILSHDKLCNTSKSPNYVAIMPWSLWEKPTVDQELLEALDG
jgi:Subtilase family